MCVSDRTEERGATSVPAGGTRQDTDTRDHRGPLTLTPSSLRFFAAGSPPIATWAGERAGERGGGGRVETE